MLSLVRSSAAALRVARFAPVSASVRSFASKKDDTPAEEGYFPTDREQSTGISRAEAMVEDSFNVEFFDRDATAALPEEGSRENPIPVLATTPSRIVGISLEDDSNIRWFTLKQGEVAFDPVTENYLALKVVTQAQLDEFVAAAEAEA